MAINVDNLEYSLDVRRPNQRIFTRFYQGNPNGNFVISLTDNSKRVTITDGIKPVIYFLYFAGSTLIGKIKFAETLADGTANPDYNVTVVDNKITIPTSEYLFGHAGKVEMIISIADGNKYYTYSCYYEVDKNEAYADSNLNNVPEKAFDQKFKETTVYNTIWNRLPELKGVKAKYLEQQDEIPQDAFNTPEQTLHLVYQIAAEDQNIRQQLPSISINKVLIIQVLFSTGITNGSVTLVPATGEHFNGAATPFVINTEGIAGAAFSTVDGWDWVPFAAMHEVGIDVNDQRSNFFIGMKALAFGAGFTTEQDPDQKDRVKIDFSSGSGSNSLTFHDGNLNQDFTASKVQSLDKSIRIANLNGVADLSKGISEHNGCKLSKTYC